MLTSTVGAQVGAGYAAAGYLRDLDLLALSFLFTPPMTLEDTSGNHAWLDEEVKKYDEVCSTTKCLSTGKLFCWCQWWC